MAHLSTIHHSPCAFRSPRSLINVPAPSPAGSPGHQLYIFRHFLVGWKKEMMIFPFIPNMTIDYSHSQLGRIWRWFYGIEPTTNMMILWWFSQQSWWFTGGKLKICFDYIIYTSPITFPYNPYIAYMDPIWRENQKCSKSPTSFKNSAGSTPLPSLVDHRPTPGVPPPRNFRCRKRGEFVVIWCSFSWEENGDWNAIYWDLLLILKWFNGFDGDCMVSYRWSFKL